MSLVSLCVVATAVLAAEPAASPETAVLRETVRPGDTTAVLIELTAEGTVRTQEPAAGEKARDIPLKVNHRFDFVDRLQRVSEEGFPQRIVRLVRQAAVAVNVTARPTATEIRPAVSTIVAVRRGDRVESFSPGGPLTRKELDLIETPADPLLLAGLLVEKAVGVGDIWPVRSEVAKLLTQYDALASNTLKAKVESLDADSARIRIAGEVRGAENGAEGVVTIEGRCVFDRKVGRISQLNLTRKESRKLGPVSPAMEMKGTVTLERRAIEPPPELSDKVLAALPTDEGPERFLLRLVPPNAPYTLLHDRGWHLFWDDERQVVLKRLDGGETVAQCNLNVGPNAGRGRHQDPTQFRAEIKQALGARFVTFLADGETDGTADGEFRYRIVAQGKQKDLDVVWIYDLLASGEGDQILAAFTLTAERFKADPAIDSAMLGTLEWTKAAPAASAPK